MKPNDASARLLWLDADVIRGAPAGNLVTINRISVPREGKYKD
jgi:hypothetical protein